MPSAGSSSTATHDSSSETSDEDSKKEEADAVVPDKFIEEEHRAHGGVKASVYWEYIKAGKLKWWAILVILMVLGRVITIGQTYFLKEWGEAYETTDSLGFSDIFKRLPSPARNVRVWLVIFFFFALVQIVRFLLAQVLMLVIVYTAGRQMFEDILYKVCYATFRFYDVTPVGRLMNRMTSDINIIDGDISVQFQDVAFNFVTWLTSLLVIASVTPLFLVFSALLTLAFVMIFGRFLPTSQSLRRLEVLRQFHSSRCLSLSLIIDGLSQSSHVQLWRSARRFNYC